MSETVLLRRENGIATVTLNRPDKRNALCRELIQALGETFQKLREATDVRCVVLTGNGPAFCAGMDLDELRNSLSAEPGQIQQDALNLAHLYREIQTHPLPTICAVNGSAVAGGAGLVSVCDLAISVPEAKFGYPEVRRGLVAAMVLPHLLRHVGERMARYLLLTGELIDANEALGCGMINHVVSAEALMQASLQWAESIRQGGPSALKKTKELFDQFDRTGNDLESLARASAEPRFTEECVQGLGAFFGKTTAPWAK